MNFFDSEFENESANSEIKPYHTVKNKKDKDILQWLNTITGALEKQAITRHMSYRRNMEAYRGISIKTLARDNRKGDRQTFNNTSKFIVNHLHDMTETRVSQMCRAKPHVDIIPTNDEFEDKNAAKAVKLLVNHLWYINDMDTLIQKMQRFARIFGESYLFIEWDKDAGDLHPMWVAARDSNLPPDVLDEAGEAILDSEGDPQKIDLRKPIKTGDVKYTIEFPWRILLHRKKSFKEVEYCIRVNVKATEDLKLDYPKLKDKIKTNRNIKLYDAEELLDHLLEEETIVYDFFHKPTRYCPDGARIRYTTDVILDKRPYPYSHSELPFVRLTDMDIPDTLNGVSAYEMLRPLQSMHNNLSTLLAKNIYLTGHAKWVMPRGACKIESLGNDSTIVQYQGAVPPQMLQVKPNPQEAYAFRDHLVQEMGQIYGVQGVSRGAPPPGITAGVALQFLNEQEQERATSDIAKHNEMIQHIARKSIAVAGDYYDASDGRLLRIVGKDNQYSIRHFDSANLSKDYDVRVQVGSALPESKAGKIQRIIEIMQMKPDLLSNERWIDLLEFGNTEKMNTLLTAAVKAAESENEDILAGKIVGDPETWEDHIIHWRTHVRALQSRSFKEETPIEIRMAMLEHISVTEFAMIEKAKVNPLFEAKMAELALFPIASPDYTARSREHMAMVAQAQANKGEKVTTIIPGTELEEGVSSE